MAVAESLEPLEELVGAIRIGSRVLQVHQQLDGAVVSLRRSFRDPRRDLFPDRRGARRYVLQVLLPRLGVRACLALTFFLGLFGEAALLHKETLSPGF